MKGLLFTIAAAHMYVQLAWYCKQVTCLQIPVCYSPEPQWIWHKGPVNTLHWTWVLTNYAH